MNDDQRAPALETPTPEVNPRRGRSSARLAMLDATIQRHPAEAENYLLRAELLLERGWRGDDLAAAVDLYRAAALAQARFEREDWGIAAQITRDRAQQLLNELAEQGVVVEVAPAAEPEFENPVTDGTIQSEVQQNVQVETSSDDPVGERWND